MNVSKNKNFRQNRNFPAESLHDQCIAIPNYSQNSEINLHSNCCLVRSVITPSSSRSNAIQSFPLRSRIEFVRWKLTVPRGSIRERRRIYELLRGFSAGQKKIVPSCVSSRKRSQDRVNRLITRGRCGPGPWPLRVVLVHLIPPLPAVGKWAFAI